MHDKAPGVRRIKKTRRVTVRIVLALAILLVVLPAAWFVALSNSPTVQGWVVDHWVPREDEKPTSHMLSDGALARRAGFEPATSGLEVPRSIRAELPAPAASLAPGEAVTESG